jgi:hypothetical protein
MGIRMSSLDIWWQSRKVSGWHARRRLWLNSNSFAPSIETIFQTMCRTILATRWFVSTGMTPARIANG